MFSGLFIDVAVGLGTGVVVAVSGLSTAVGLFFVVVALGDTSGTRPASKVSAMTVGKYSVGIGVGISVSPKLRQLLKKISKASNSQVDNVFTRRLPEYDCLVRIPVKTMPWIPDR